MPEPPQRVLDTPEVIQFVVDYGNHGRSPLLSRGGVAATLRKSAKPPCCAFKVASQLLFDRASTPPRLRRGVRSPEMFIPTAHLSSKESRSSPHRRESPCASPSPLP